VTCSFLVGVAGHVQIPSQHHLREDRIRRPLRRRHSGTPQRSKPPTPRTPAIGTSTDRPHR